MKPFLCYTVEDGPVRLVIADTIEPGRHSGRLHPAVAEWLQRVLAKRPELAMRSQKRAKRTMRCIVKKSMSAVAITA